MTATVVAQGKDGPGPAGRFMIGVSRRLNPFLRPFAMKGIGVLGVIDHRGRTSGRVYSTPVAVRQLGGDFVVPLPYGATTDWCRNVIGAGEATVRYRGRDYAVREPEVVGLDVADRAYGLLRFALRLFGIRRFLLLRRVP